VADGAHQLVREVFDRGEDAAGNDIALDLGKPVFDLVEPRNRSESSGGGVWGERRGIAQPAWSYRGQVVRDNMDLLAVRLVGDQVGEEGHKLLAGVGHIVLEPMGLESGPPPLARHHRMANPQSAHPRLAGSQFFALPRANPNSPSSKPYDKRRRYQYQCYGALVLGRNRSSAFLDGRTLVWAATWSKRRLCHS
jgi:hypothetical protein